MAATATHVVARQAWPDYAKAIGIVLVVFGHCSRSIASSGMVWSEQLRLADHLVYSFHMPLFFLIGGYLSTLSRRRDPHGFLVGTWWGVLFPYLLGSVIWVALKVEAPGIAHEPLRPDALMSILWAPIDHLWFLYNLLIARTVWFVVNPSSAPRLGLAILVASFISAIYWDASILADVAYYGTGAMLLDLALPTDRRTMLMAIFACALLWLVFVLPASNAEHATQRIVTALLGVAAVILLARIAPEPVTVPWRALGFIGEASLVIYLLHLYFATSARVGLQLIGYMTPQTLLVTATTAGLLGPIVLQVLLLKLNARTGWNLSQWVGLGTLFRSSYFDFSWPKSAVAGAIDMERK